MPLLLISFEFAATELHVVVIVHQPYDLLSKTRSLQPPIDVFDPVQVLEKSASPFALENIKIHTSWEADQLRLSVVIPLLQGFEMVRDDVPNDFCHFPSLCLLISFEVLGGALQHGVLGSRSLAKSA